MGSIDSATWQALGLLLTLCGLGLSALTWRRRGPARGLRGVAWSLLPLAAGLTGVLRLGWEITESVVRWLTRLVFSPFVWLGLVVAALSLVLFVVSGWMVRRSGGPQDATPPRAPSLPAGGKPPAGSGTAGDDMADIEEILRKHGIQ